MVTTYKKNKRKKRVLHERNGNSSIIFNSTFELFLHYVWSDLKKDCFFLLINKGYRVGDFTLFYFDHANQPPNTSKLNNPKVLLYFHSIQISQFSSKN